MGISRHATAHWEGDLKTGKGQLSTPQSGVMDNTRYAFSSRFGDEKGTNPEELIAAAHAGCFTMALSAQLTEAGFSADLAGYARRCGFVDGRRPAVVADPSQAQGRRAGHRRSHVP